MVREVEGVATLDAKKVVVDAALVAIVAADDLHARIATPDAQRGLAAVATVVADCADVVHLPGTGLVAIRSRGERADRADIDAHAAFFALEVIFLVGGDDGVHTAVLHTERPDVHGFAAHAHAAVAQDAARTVEVHHRRPLLLVLVVLGLHEFRFGGAVGERHVLQFALAAGIADGAIQRMVAEEQFNHRLARLDDFFIVGGDDHALGNQRGAGRLELGHLLDFHETHAAGALQGQIGVITKRGNFDAHGLAGFDEQRPGRGR